jgi:hypothetical protein
MGPHPTPLVRAVLPDSMTETKLPYEDAVAGQVPREVQDLLERLDAALAFAICLLDKGGITITKTRGLRSSVVNVVLGLFVKACRTLRAIRRLAALGFAEDAFVLARSLFETTVAIAWILQRSSQSRARMYVAHTLLQHQHMLLQWKVTPGLKRLAPRRHLRWVEEHLKPYTSEFDASTLRELRRTWHEGTFKDACRTIGLLRLYETFYRRASATGHAADLPRYLSFTDAGITILKIGPGDFDALPEVLRKSYLAFWLTLRRLDSRFGLGRTADVDGLTPS